MKCKLHYVTYILEQFPIVLLFLIVHLSLSSSSLLGAGEETSRIDSNPAYSEEILDDFNQELQTLSDEKIQLAHEAHQKGNYRQSQRYLREAIYLETLRVEEGEMSDAKILGFKEQLSKDQRKFWIKRFMSKGDQLAETGLFDLAVDEYEKIFLLDPNHRKASKKIDQLKKKYIDETHEIFEEQAKYIEREIQRRADIYLKHAQELVNKKRLREAMRLLKRILILDPKNKDTKKLLKKVKKEIKNLDS